MDTVTTRHRTVGSKLLASEEAPDTMNAPLWGGYGAGPDKQGRLRAKPTVAILFLRKGNPDGTTTLFCYRSGLVDGLVDQRGLGTTGDDAAGVADPLSGRSDPMSGDADPVPGAGLGLSSARDQVSAGDHEVPDAEHGLPGGPDQVSAGDHEVPGGAYDLSGGPDQVSAAEHEVPGGGYDLSGGPDQVSAAEYAVPDGGGGGGNSVPDSPD